MALLALLALTGCRRETEAERVDPAGHEAFYLWPGVRPAKNVRAKILYLLDGEVRRRGPVRLEKLRMGMPRLPSKKIWLVVRADRLDWNDAVYETIFDDLHRWREAGNEVVGLQVDFDAATRGIGGYGNFLRDLRQRLPRHWRLSITGLMDWSAHGDPRALARLAGLIDEVVVQTYQGRIGGHRLCYRVIRNSKAMWCSCYPATALTAIDSQPVPSRKSTQGWRVGLRYDLVWWFVGCQRDLRGCAWGALRLGAGDCEWVNVKREL
ncbi:DUF3142 domain-containing protein [Sphingobium sp. SA916]|uniref:DUF3142 domain-containing protein n=1 Tax=Sphingobium sp. SA916 TaxID=1851207 RepID=UPI00209C4004|nr:DUF3142 domain-containing protein [Sphingobium sp. SA916]